jgi:hypothetical protein
LTPTGLLMEGVITSCAFASPFFGLNECNRDLSPTSFTMRV